MTRQLVEDGSGWDGLAPDRKEKRVAMRDARLVMLSRNQWRLWAIIRDLVDMIENRHLHDECIWGDMAGRGLDDIGVQLVMRAARDELARAGLLPPIGKVQKHWPKLSLPPEVYIPPEERP